MSNDWYLHGNSQVIMLRTNPHLDTVRCWAAQQLVYTFAVPVQGCEVQARVMPSFIRQQRVSTVCDQVLHTVRMPVNDGNNEAN